MANLLEISTSIDLLAEPKLLVATQVNIPMASTVTFTHCNVKVPLEKLLVKVMVIEPILLLRGCPLCNHPIVGKGIPSKSHVRVKFPFMSKYSTALLVAVTLGAPKSKQR